MSNVKPKEGGPCSLYCYDCGEWIPNTANFEMIKEGAYAYSHICKASRMRKKGDKVSEIRERLAELAHAFWANWTAYMLAHNTEEDHQRWMRQLNTSYSGLSEREKNSDREIADQILAILGVTIAEDRDAETLKKVGEWLKSQFNCVERAGDVPVWLCLEWKDLDALLQGKMPEEVEDA